MVLYKKYWYVILMAISVEAFAQENSATAGIEQKRQAAIAAMLPDKPKGFGDPIEQRHRWDSLYRTGKFTRLIHEADSLSALPFPKLTEQIYMTFYGGKDSETSKRFIMKRRMWLTQLIWAECLTNKGKYWPAILAGLTDILNTVSWTFPAEDQQKTNYNGTLFTVGLSSSAYGNDMAQALYLLQSKLPVSIKEQIIQSLKKKVFNPVHNALANNNAKKEFTSLYDKGNHNPVTLANVTNAALAVLQDKNERAFFIALSEKYVQKYIDDYNDDGYCSEGINYYSYGFGHFSILREGIWQATSGKVDLFKAPKIDKIARFAPAMEIINGMYATIGDCEQNIKPAPQIMYYLNRYFNLGLAEYDDLQGSVSQPSLSYMMYFFPNSASAKKVVAKEMSNKQSLRDYFSSSGVLTVRRASGEGMGATFKGGHNAEQHNHNDLGSYTIVVGDELLTGDPGLRTYTPTYFGKQRYELHITPASYGHNVPLINGVQQKVGREAEAKITSTDFTDAKDVFKMDILSAYPLRTLKKLDRTFTYSRGKETAIIIEDEFAADSAIIFETALITRYPWKKISENEIQIFGKREKLRIIISASGEPVKVSEKIIDEGPTPYTRIGIQLSSQASGKVSLKFEKL